MLGGGNSNIFGIFTPNLGEDDPILTSIFFKGVGSTTNQVDVDMEPTGEVVEYKFVEFQHGDVKWEDLGGGKNRTLKVDDKMEMFGKVVP